MHSKHKYKDREKKVSTSSSFLIVYYLQSLRDVPDLTDSVFCDGKGKSGSLCYIGN